MDEIETALESETSSFGKEIAKSFALSTAATAGVLAGFVVVGFTVSKVQDLMNARKAKKDNAEIEKA